jgi:dynein heavy chain 1
MEVSTPPSQGLTANGGISPPPFPTIEPERVLEHLISVCQIALGSSKEDLEAPGSLLHAVRYSETISRCTRFANDSQNVLYIQKDIAASSAVDNGGDAAGELFPFRLCLVFLGAKFVLVKLVIVLTVHLC